VGSWIALVLTVGAVPAVSPLPGAAVRAQEVDSPDAPRGVFTSSSDLVVLHAAVTDRRGAFVGGLPREAFAIREDGRLQQIAFFDEQDAPVTVGLVVDSSGSMLQTRDLLLAAVHAFAEASHPADEFFALTFNERVRLALRDERFTRDPAVLREALSANLTVRGRTALHDAVLVALEAVAQGAHTRKVLVVIADGGDNASRASFDELLTRARASNAVIYTVAVVDPLNWDADPGRLRRLAAATGGLSYEPPGVAQLETALGRIARDIRSSYTLAYAPSDAGRDGRLHRIEVRVRTPDGRRLVVRTRDAYLSRAASGGPPPPGQETVR
jgi:VWFA-related protein